MKSKHLNISYILIKTYTCAYWLEVIASTGFFDDIYHKNMFDHFLAKSNYFGSFPIL